MTLENENLNKEGFVTLKKWLENRNRGKTFADYFHEYGYQSIAIYDAGELGRLLYDEINDSDIGVKYFIDRNAEGIKEIDGIPVIILSQIGGMEEVDVLLVSPVVNYDAVCRLLAESEPEIRTLAFRDAVFEF